MALFSTWFIKISLSHGPKIYLTWSQQYGTLQTTHYMMTKRPFCACWDQDAKIGDLRPGHFLVTYFTFSLFRNKTVYAWWNNTKAFNREQIKYSRKKNMENTRIFILQKNTAFNGFARTSSINILFLKSVNFLLVGIRIVVRYV